MIRRAALALLVACHATPPSPTPSPSPPPSQTPTPLPTPTPTPPPPPTASAEPEGPKHVYDVDAWFRSRGALPPRAFADGGDCVEATLQGHDALMCRGVPDSLPTGQSVYPLSIFYVASHKTELALVTPIAAGPLDREIVPGRDPADDMYVELEATLDPAGTTLTIAEKPKRTCNKALAEYTSSELAGQRRVVQKTCAARGKYAMQNGKLVRVP